MPVELIGMIGVKPEGDATVHVIGGYPSTSAEGFGVASYAASQTERLSFLIAHRPGFVTPTLAARTAATLDHLTGGRVALHIITGGTDSELARDGDQLDKDNARRLDVRAEVARRDRAAVMPSTA